MPRPTLDTPFRREVNLALKQIELTTAREQRIAEAAYAWEQAAKKSGMYLTTKEAAKCLAFAAGLAGIVALAGYWLIANFIVWVLEAVKNFR